MGQPWGRKNRLLISGVRDEFEVVWDLCGAASEIRAALSKARANKRVARLLRHFFYDRPVVRFFTKQTMIAMKSTLRLGAGILLAAFGLGCTSVPKTVDGIPVTPAEWQAAKKAQRRRITRTRCAGFSR